MALWTSADAARATGGTSTAEWVAHGVSIDTRSLQKGDLFVALAAERDGHDFVKQALENGAAAALVTHRPAGVAADAPLLIVADVLKALEKLGIAARARTNARIVAVTGSVGKTSTKEMLRTALAGQGRTHASVASYNNHWGVPLTLARMPQDTDFAVIEIGMNHPGEISPLSRMTRPHVVMITTVAAAHLEAFDNIDGIAREKASICDGLEPHGVAVINGDLPNSWILCDAAERAGARVVTFGQQAHDHHRLTDVRFSAGHTIGQGRAWRTPILFKVGTEGRHFAVNAIGAIAVLTALGADRTRGVLDLGQWAPPPGRGTREVLVMDPAVSEATLDLIDDAFNANPTSLSAALEILAASTPRNDVGRIVKGRRIAILGDMLELGPEEIALHQGIAADPSMGQITTVHCVGPRMQALYRILPEAQRGLWTATAPELAEIAGRLIDSGDVVLVKGSKGSKVSLVVDAIRKLGQRRQTLGEEA